MISQFLQVLDFMVGVHIPHDSGLDCVDPVLARRAIGDHSRISPGALLRLLRHGVHALLLHAPACLRLAHALPQRPRHRHHRIQAQVLHVQVRGRWRLRFNVAPPLGASVQKHVGRVPSFPVLQGAAGAPALQNRASEPAGFLVSRVYEWQQPSGSQASPVDKLVMDLFATQKLQEFDRNQIRMFI